MTDAKSVQSRPVHRPRGATFVAARFIIRHTYKSALLWGAVFAAYVYSSALGFLDIAPNPQARAHILESFTSNTGLKALLGEPHNVYAIGGFVDWRNLSIVALVGAMWGLFTSTRVFRGDEESGRWELFLAGQNTARTATAQALLGVGSVFMSMGAVTMCLTWLVGRHASIGFTVVQSVLFGAIAVSSAGVFLSLGALLSQVMPTRASANSAGAVLLGGFFLLRAAADLMSGAHWLLYVTPFGWIERAHPLSTDRSPVWLLPLMGSMLVFCACAVYLAGRRDYGESILADRQTARPHLRLLGAPFLIALRFSRSSIAGWLVAILVFGIFFGSLAKSAGQAFSSSTLVQKLGSDLIHRAQVTGAKIYVGFIFFLLMTLLMVLVASAMSRVREDESEGYLDNLLVRRTGRAAWLAGRTVLVFATVLLASFGAALSVWAIAAGQHVGLDFQSMLRAGVNTMAPALLLLGIGVFVFSFLPRFTSTVLYGFIVWSFLLQLVGSILRLNHWLLDTSALYHIMLAPSVSPNWQAVGMYVGASAVLSIIGICYFRVRDIQVV